MKKKVLALLIMVFTLLLSTVPIFAKDGQYVYDEIGVLSSEEIDQLNDIAKDLEEKTGVEFYIVLTDVDTASSDDYANQTLQQIKESDDAALVAINPTMGQLNFVSVGWGKDYENQETVLKLVDAYNEANTYLAAFEKMYEVLGAVVIETDPNIPEEHLKKLLEDEADLLTEAEEAELLNLLELLSNDVSCDIAVVVVDEYKGTNVLDAAADYYDYNGYGYGEDDSGILLFISMTERDYATLTYGYGIHSFTDEGLIYLENAFLDDLSAGNYFDAFKTFANHAHELIKMARNGSVYGEEVEKEASIFDTFRLAMSGLMGVLIAFITTGGMKKELNNVKAEAGASRYVTENHFNMRNNYDFLTHRDVRRTKVERSNNSGGGSGTRSTFRSSSGRVHGGRSGKF